MLYLHLYICGIPPHMDNEHSWEMGQSYSLLLCDHILASVVHIIHIHTCTHFIKCVESITTQGKYLSQLASNSVESYSCVGCFKVDSPSILLRQAYSRYIYLFVVPFPFCTENIRRSYINL